MSVAATVTLADDTSPASYTLVGSIHRALRYDIFGIRGMTLQRFGWVALFVGAFALTSTIGNIMATDGLRSSFATVAKLTGDFVQYYALWFVPAMIAGTLADNLPLRGAQRVAVLAIALLLAASLRIPYVLYFEPCGTDCDNDRAALGLAWAVLNVFCFTSAIAVACFARRRDQEIAAALHASELARVDAERARLQSELQTMQARVEPTFLLDALHDVGALYESDRKAGGRMLDLLIQYLRAALPQMRETDSTLEREIGLLRSYLGILALQSNGALTVAVHLDEAIANARMPPMVLVPLVTGALPSPSSLGLVKTETALLDGRVRITLAAKGAIATRIADSKALSEVGTRLKAIYGDRATFAVERNDGALRLIVEFPFESARPYEARAPEQSARVDQ